MNNIKEHYKALIKINQSIERIYRKSSKIKSFKVKISPGRRLSSIPKQQLEAERLYLEGYEKKRIIQLIGISLMTLYRWAKKGNWDEKYRVWYQREFSKIFDPDEKMYFFISKRRPKSKKD